MSDITWTDKDLGPVDAYALAVAGGYTGTKEQWIEEIANASINASNSEAYAKGTRGGEAVDSDDPAYHNNSKYYDEQAALEKAAAQAAAETASAAYNVNLLAPNYDATATYKVGDHVIYSGGYYVCNTAISTAEAWTAAHWTQLTLGKENSDLKSALKMVADGGKDIDITGYSIIQCVITNDNTVIRSSNKYRSYQFAPDETWVSIEITAKSGNMSHITFVKEAIPGVPTSGADISSYLCTGETGRHVINAGKTGKFTIPSDCAYIVIPYISNNTDVTAVKVTVYSAIADEITELQEAMDSKMDKMLDRNFDWSVFASDNYPLGWQKGYYAAANGGTGTDNDNIRTIRGNAYIANKGDVLFTLSAPAGYHAQISEYNASGTWQRTIGNHDSGGNVVTAELTEGYLYRFCIGGFDGDAEDYLTEAFIATVTGTISRDFISWQQDQDARITALESGESEIPEYYTKDGWLQGRLDEITSVQNAIGKHQDSFWLISDYHHQYNEGKSIPLLKHLVKRTGINKIIFAGDAGGAYGPSDAARYHRLQLSANAWEDMASCADYFFGVLGNHEWINTGTITQAGVMGAFLNRYKVSYEVDADTGNYIVNNNANKIRYYFVQDTNAAYPVSGTLGWLYNDLMTLPDGWSVALFMHFAWVAPTYFEYECDGATIEYNRPIVSFMTTMLQGFRDHTTVTYDNVDYDFSGRTETNHVIGIFSGHLHHGLMFAADNEYNTRKILTFMAMTDCMHAQSVAVDGSPWYWEDGIVDGTKIVRESETVTEQCFYAVQIDLDEKKVHITAVGGDHDYEDYYEEPEET